MNFILGAMVLDCFMNSNKESSDSGVGILTGIGLIIYTIVKLPKIEQYILQIGYDNKNLMMILIIAFTILIPVYWFHADKNNYRSIWVNLLLRIILYMDIFFGIAIMIIVCNQLGSHPASLIFNIDKVVANSKADGLFLSLFSSIWYLGIRALDFICVVALIPIIQIILVLILKKILAEDITKSNVSKNVTIKEVSE